MGSGGGGSTVDDMELAVTRVVVAYAEGRGSFLAATRRS